MRRSILIILSWILLSYPHITIGQEIPIGNPEDVGLSSKRLQRINSVMQNYITEGKVAGITTMIARKGKVAHFGHFGFRDLAKKDPIQDDTIFRIYSMTKPITTVAVMMLYEEGHFQLNDPISNFIPEFKDIKAFKGITENGFELAELERPITVRDLLTHTSGLSYGFGNTPIDSMYREENLLFNLKRPLRDMVKALARIPLLHQPGRTWEYSMSTDVLGYLVEIVSGMSLDQFMVQRIFQPLGMPDTGFYIPDNKKGRFAEMYSPDENGNLKVSEATYRIVDHSPTILFGGGGLASTASDYMKFSQMLLNGGVLNGVRLLSPKTVQLMTSNHLLEGINPFYTPENSDPAGWGYGFGVAVLMDVTKAQILGSVGEFGWNGAANTIFWVDPSEDLIGILMLQMIPTNTYPVAQQFKVLTYQALMD